MVEFYVLHLRSLVFIPTDCVRKDILARHDELPRGSFSPVSSCKIAVCILHLGLRITEKLLRLEVDANYTMKHLSLAQRKKHVESFNDAITPFAPIRVLPPGHQKSKDSKVSERSEVLGLKGDHIYALAKNAHIFIRQYVGNVSHSATTRYEEALKLWMCWHEILEALREHHVDGTHAKAQLALLVDEFAQRYLSLYAAKEVTPYIHILVCHLPDVLGTFVDLSVRSQQGLERTHGDHKLVLRTAVSHGPGLSDNPSLSNMQLMLRDYRLRLMEKDPTRFDPDIMKKINHDEDQSCSSNAVDESGLEDSHDV